MAFESKADSNVFDPATLAFIRERALPHLPNTPFVALETYAALSGIAVTTLRTYLKETPIRYRAASDRSTRFYSVFELADIIPLHEVHDA